MNIHSDQKQLKANTIFDDSSPNTSSTWYILALVGTIVVSGILAFLFIKFKKRPEKFENLSKKRYILKILGVFYDLGSHVLALIVIIYTGITFSLTPWRQVQDGNQDVIGSAIYVNANNVDSGFTISDYSDTITISGENCLKIWSDYDGSYNFPPYSPFVIAELGLCIISIVIIAFKKFNYALYSTDKYKIFIVQCLNYFSVLAAGNYTMAHNNYCYGYDPSYVDQSDGGSDDFTVFVQCMIWFSAGTVVFYIYIMLMSRCVRTVCCVSNEVMQERLSRLTNFLWFGVILGILWRVMTFLQGFSQPLTSTLLSNDIIFHIHMSLSLIAGTGVVADAYHLVRSPKKNIQSVSSAA